MVRRVAIVTGAAQGIGRGIAQALASDGCQVVVADINADEAAETARSIQAQGGECRVRHCDIRSDDSMRELVDDTVASLGGVHVLVNNAVVGSGTARLEDKTRANFELSMQASFYAPLAAMQQAFPSMRRQGFGRVINMCSLNGVNAHLYTADYNASKEALRCLTRSAAREWAAHGITVNAVCPGAKTPAFERFAQSSPDNAARVEAANPMGHLGDPLRDIAGVVCFLASEAACYTTGNTLFVDGGSHINGVAWEPQLPGA